MSSDAKTKELDDGGEYHAGERANPHFGESELGRCSIRTTTTTSSPSSDQKSHSIQEEKALQLQRGESLPRQVKFRSLPTPSATNLNAPQGKWAYEPLPRPFTEHMKEIEKRRARKMIEIMNSSEESFTDKDKRVKFAPQAALIFHVLELRDLDVNDTTFIRSLPVSFYCVISIGPIKRCSKITHSKSAKRIRMDWTSHLSIEVPEWRESPLNRFNLELWSYQDPEMHYIVGSMEIHVYDFIRKQHAVEKSNLWSDKINVGKIYYEYAFSYGCFGYGHSNHLKID